MATGPSTPDQLNKYRGVRRKPTQAPLPKGASVKINAARYAELRKPGKKRPTQAPAPKGALVKPTLDQYISWRATKSKKKPAQAPVVIAARKR